MYDIFDANELLINVIDVQELTSLINGSICNDGRPLNSLKQDIVVNTITITQKFKPQIATSNINIYTQDLSNGSKNISKMKQISRKVIEILNRTQLHGKSITIEDQGILQEANLKEHYLNLRIKWRIYDQKQNIN